MSSLPPDPADDGPLPAEKAIASAAQAADVIRNIDWIRGALAQPNGIATLGPDGILASAQQPSGGGGGGGGASVIQGGSP